MSVARPKKTPRREQRPAPGPGRRGGADRPGPGSGGPARGPASGPDPKSPLVVDLRELGRSPGAMRDLMLAVPAPQDMAVPMVGVPVGSTMTVEGRLESVVEGVLVTARVSAPLHGECGRCLEEFDHTVAVRVQELFCYPERLADMGVDEDDDEDELPLVEGDLIDLEPVIRDAIVLSLPINPLCRPDCEGLAFDGGPADEDDAPKAAPVDARWAALQAISLAAADESAAVVASDPADR